MLRKFRNSEDGYAFALTLISLPAMIALGLLLIDMGRGNNAQTDYQAAVDALALAGARELDIGTDSITRAQSAMENLANTVSFLDLADSDGQITLSYESDGTGDFRVEFLTDIPDDDDTVIDNTYILNNRVDPANYDTNGADAMYVYVGYRGNDFCSFTDRLRGVNCSGGGGRVIGAYAVATYNTAACDVTPVFICNPFEKEPIGSDLQSAFADGQLHARLLRLHPPGSSTALPGNFGFLQVTGNNENTNAGANALRAVFAGDKNPTCYNSSRVTTKPGAAVSIRTGLNTRFDIYDAPFSNAADKRAYPPAANVRKGYAVDNPGSSADACPDERSDDPTWLTTSAFPPNATMSLPNQGVPGAAIGTGSWDARGYWLANHGGTLTDLTWTEMSSFGTKVKGSDNKSLPSRYDVYRYEIDNGLVGNTSDPESAAYGAQSENGTPSCYAHNVNNPGPTTPTTSEDDDRRVIFAAIVDCIENGGTGITEFPVNAFASIFLVSPMEKNGTDDGSIDVEIIDITGTGGNGTLDTFVRDEAVLVR